MFPPYIFLFVWLFLPSVLPKFMMHTWNYFTLKVSEYIVNLYFKHCVSRMYFRFGIRLCISLHFKTVTDESLWIPILPMVQVESCGWALSPSAPAQSTHRLYTQALHAAFSTASPNVPCSVSSPPLKHPLPQPVQTASCPIHTRSEQCSRNPFLTRSRGSLYCKGLWCCSRQLQKQSFEEITVRWVLGWLKITHKEHSVSGSPSSWSDTWSRTQHWSVQAHLLFH